MIKAIFKSPGKPARLIEMEDTLKEYQKHVGGYIETLTCNDIVMIINEEGKIRGLEPNFAILGDFICGTALFVGINQEGDDFADIPVQYQRDLNLVFTRY